MRGGHNRHWSSHYRSLDIPRNCSEHGPKTVRAWVQIRQARMEDIDPTQLSQLGWRHNISIFLLTSPTWFKARLRHQDTAASSSATLGMLLMLKAGSTRSLNSSKCSAAVATSDPRTAQYLSACTTAALPPKLQLRFFLQL